MLRTLAGRTLGAFPNRYRAVADSATPAKPAPGPLYSTRPPCVPAPGPRSTSQSASAITCGLCSTTNTEFPAARKRFKAVSSSSVSAGCSPAEGSSRTYKTPNKPLPSCVARCSRCNSPPDSVAVVRSVPR